MKEKKMKRMLKNIRNAKKKSSLIDWLKWFYGKAVNPLKQYCFCRL
jgi:hypothetical protein